MPQSAVAMKKPAATTKAKPAEEKTIVKFTKATDKQQKPPLNPNSTLKNYLASRKSSRKSRPPSKVVVKASKSKSVSAKQSRDAAVVKKPSVMDSLFPTGGIVPNDLITASTRKSWLYTMLNPKSHTWQSDWFRHFISGVILIDFGAYIVSTEPSIQEEDIPLFYATEAFASIIFLCEYIARLYTITEHKNYEHPVKGRLQYISHHFFSFTIDTIAIFPFFLEEITGVEMPRLSFLRIFRLLRIMKTNGMVQATDAVWRVIYYNRQILYVALFVCLFLILLTSILMYLLRPREPHIQSQDFQSILSTMYLSTLMLTGQGGPEGNLPWYTKGVVLLTGVFSLGMFAIPASMLTWGFEAEAARCAKRARELSRRRDMGEVVYDDDYSTDEEYQKIIAGEESDLEEDDDDSSEETKRLIAKFKEADKDGSGTISVTEYLQLAKLSNGGSDPFAMSSRQTMVENRLDKLESKLDKMAEQLSVVVDYVHTKQTKKKRY